MFEISKNNNIFSPSTFYTHMLHVCAHTHSYCFVAKYIIISLLYNIFLYRYTFKPLEEWVLPHYSCMFRPRGNVIPELEELKKKLNSARDLLGTTESSLWRKHTHFTNRAGSLIETLKEFQPEMCTMVCLSHDYHMTNIIQCTCMCMSIILSVDHSICFFFLSN